MDMNILTNGFPENYNNFNPFQGARLAAYPPALNPLLLKKSLQLYNLKSRLFQFIFLWYSLIHLKIFFKLSFFQLLL